MYKLLIIGIVFLLGFYFIYKSNDIETFSTAEDMKSDFKIADKCPDVLIQKGATYFLYNSKRANVPGVNPIRFENLEEYVEFTEWQRSQGILCPILFLQHAYDAQGESVYKARPSPTNLQGGQPDYYVTPACLPSMNIMPPPANVPVQGICAQGDTQCGVLSALPIEGTGCFGSGGTGKGSACVNNYPGFDEQNQTIGSNTPMDKMFNQTVGVSPNPMDSNWGGVEYTENLVKAGYYKDNEVRIANA